MPQIDLERRLMRPKPIEALKGAGAQPMALRRIFKRSVDTPVLVTLQPALEMLS
ncbi:MAG: hypothetical protein KDK24_01830 [Pseudooceanicola sp.]|nr:hypothetical protein [Pseudooceanicola sp.]